MGETPFRKGWYQIYWNRKFTDQAGRIKKGLDHTKVKSPAGVIEWPISEALTTKITLRCQNREGKRGFRRGFEGERIIDWAQRT
jgi:hypothetical protein